MKHFIVCSFFLRQHVYLTVEGLLFIRYIPDTVLGFLSHLNLCGSDDKESACSTGDPGSNPGSGRSPGEGNGNSLQYSCLENPMDRGVWRTTVHGVTLLHNLATEQQQSYKSSGLPPLNLTPVTYSKNTSLDLSFLAQTSTHFCYNFCTDVLVIGLLT